ncbi:MAG: divalent-cation tolerance protein CutA [Candidatus Omnitrophica bacterium]|nr:divalent-cation tolerance protein CutA [Candidatus Omnitrophota bacterium]
MAIAVMVTIPADKASELAKKLVQERVCACVNVVNSVKSFFWWNDKIDETDECLLIIKTKDSLFGRVQSMVRENHPYTVPEIISIKIDGINKEYLTWLNKEVDAYGFTPQSGEDT